MVAVTDHAQEQPPAPKPGNADVSAIRDVVEVRLVRAPISEENTDA